MDISLRGWSIPMTVQLAEKEFVAKKNGHVLTVKPL